MTKNDNRKGTAKKVIILALAFILAIGCAIGGTIAWLTDTTAPVKNTFSASGISITLEENTGTDYKMIPGATIDKDPFVTVEAGSEACWLFVKVEESANLDDFISYSVITGEGGWTALDDEDGVYYRAVEADDENQIFSVLTDDKVAVLDDVTNEALGALTEQTRPTLTFTAYAIQLSDGDGDFEVADAWEAIFAQAEANP